MSMIVADCPRCGAKSHTLDVLAQQFRYRRHNWQNWYEVFAVCRNCSTSSVWLIGLSLEGHDRKDDFYGGKKVVEFNGSLNPFFDIERYVGLRDNLAVRPPEHLSKEIENAFNEGATCLAVACYNAAATMFRLCVDLVTRPLLPDDGQAPQPNAKQRRDLGLRLAWLFENGRLPAELKELAKCIREDANDGAHAGTLTKADAEDVLDFTEALLERLVTEPKRLEIAQQRREQRRTKS